MIDIETRFRQAYDLLLEQMPDPPSYAELSTPLARPAIPRLSRWALVGIPAVAAVLIIGSVTFLGDPDPPELGTEPSVSSPTTTNTSAGPEQSIPPTTTPSRSGPLFGLDLPWTLVFDNGYDQVLAVDTVSGLPHWTPIPGGKPGDQPYRLTETGGRMVVGLGEIYSFDPDTGESLKLDDATIYVPAVEEGVVWMVDYGGAIGANRPVVWQVSVTGEQLTEKKTVEVDGYSAIGIPGGLAFETDGGVRLWDYESETILDTLGDSYGWVMDATANGSIAWCWDDCRQLEIRSTGSDSGGFSFTVDSSLLPGSGRFSGDERFFAVPVEDRVMVVDLQSSDVEPVLTFPGEVGYVRWAPGSHQLFASMYSYGEPEMTLGYYNVDSGYSAVTEVDFGGANSFVVMPTVDVLPLLGNGDASFACPVTIPAPGFIPPEPYPTHPSPDGLVWHGSEDLWTALPENGLIDSPRKSVWWSANFPGGSTEERPEIEVTWTRLDGSTRVTLDNGGEGTNAFDQNGWFMIAGIDPELPGCWQVTATYKGAELSYVYEHHLDDDRLELLAINLMRSCMFYAGYPATDFEFNIIDGVIESFSLTYPDQGTTDADRWRDSCLAEVVDRYGLHILPG